MTGLSDSLATIARYRRGLKAMMDASGGLLAEDGGARGALVETTDFGANPGGLRLFSHVPEGVGRGAPLVMALHGCGQSAAVYDQGSGWSTLAARFGFVVALAEQRRENNPQGCFNWFQPEDSARGQGEAASIRAMIRHLVATHGLDRRRIFITGLSAGGAFANVMLATYPELFAGGAIIAGLPFGAASTAQGALGLMFQGQANPDRAWGDKVRAASDHAGPWPRVSVWHGGADHTVIPANGTAIVRQWLDVHGLADAQPRHDAWGPADHRSWVRRDGGIAVESYTLPHLGTCDSDQHAGRRPGATLRGGRTVRGGGRHFIQLRHRPGLGTDRQRRTGKAGPVRRHCDRGGPGHPPGIAGGGARQALTRLAARAICRA